VDQVFRNSQTKLGVFLVVSGVSEVVGAANLDQARIFNAAVFF